MAIKVLPEDIAAQIAAGEVIERPASVVKELVENALDADATHIRVEGHGAGAQTLTISDNGRGIASAEIELALQRHATSKIRSISDIYQLHTLGFRGEALHSIASVSRMALTSRHRDERAGVRLLVEGGKILNRQQVGAPVGTVIEIADLFFNVPARRKFLKSDATERRHITTIVTDYAMAYPTVRFQVTMEGREVLQTNGNGSFADVVMTAMGIETFREMVEVTPLPPARPDLPPIEVAGFVTAPSLHRANRSEIRLFINGRAIQDQRLTYAVVQAYHTMLPTGRYPLAVLLITVPPEDVDVNVHPTKAEVRFRSPDEVFSAVQRAVRRAIINQSPPAPAYDLGRVEIANSPVGDSRQAEAITIERRISQPRAGQIAFDLDTPTPGRYRQHITPSPSEPDEEAEDRFYPHEAVPIPPHLRQTDPLSNDPTVLPERLGTPRRPRTLPVLRVIGQVGATYIVAEGPAGMYLIDQHAAHERILYEDFLAQIQSQQVTVQHVLETLTVELSPVQAHLIEEHRPLLNAVGFEFEPFGNTLYRITAVPSLLTDRDPATVLHQLLQDIENDHQPGTPNKEEKVLRRVCKSAAIKAGQIMTHYEMQALINQLERCETPLTCPHGRPTMIHLSNDQLASQFGRR